MNFFIGQRVADKDNVEIRGTVRYIGPVCISKNQDQTFIGVEWDQEGRGKYDGSVTDSDGNIVRYFTCGEKMGSFVKPKMLDTGKTLIKALQDRYSQELDDVMGGVDEDMFVETERGNSVDVKKYQKLDKIVVASTPNECVSEVGDEKVLADMVKNLQRVDIHENLLCRWSDVFKIGHALPKLTFLQLDYNYLLPLSESALPISTTTTTTSTEESTSSIPPAPSSTTTTTTTENDENSGENKLPFQTIMEGAFNHLTDLILSYTKVLWSDVVTISPYLPKLMEIYLVGNHIKELDPPLPEGVFQCLRVFDVCHNDIEQWSNLNVVNKLPKLEVLLFGYNPLGDINEELPVFTTVEIVNSHNSNISNWNTIQELVRIFPKLRTLRLQETPLTKDLGPDIARREIIARIPTLTRLNGSDIRSKQRIDSERYYLQRCITDIMEKNHFKDYSEWLNSTDEFKKNVVKNYPRYDELVKIHGEPVPSGAQKSTVQEISKIKVSFESHIASSCTQERITKTLPLSMKIKDLMMLFKRLYKVEESDQKLYFKNKDEMMLSPIDDVEKTLEYYGMSDEALIVIEGYDAELEKKLEEKKKLNFQMNKWVDENEEI